MILETPRLTLRQLDEADAPFMLALLNDEAFIRFIGDRKVRTETEARAYIRSGAMASYEQHGHGLYLVASKELGEPIGTCGVLKRDALPDPDLGFAFLAGHRARGYGREAASAMLAYARRTLGMSRMAAIVSPENEPSLRLLRGLGFTFERMVRMADDEPEIFYLACELPD
ncbi:MAG TPA: GNAT family N-acetyltransferase [Gemmatimonadales bacterium]|nr:GNAT family N-acetyltransferase [Gemmatimonadales bacterium]